MTDPTWPPEPSSERTDDLKIRPDLTDHLYAPTSDIARREQLIVDVAAANKRVAASRLALDVALAELRRAMVEEIVLVRAELAEGGVVAGDAGHADGEWTTPPTEGEK